MSDIFLSYAAEDRAIAKELATALADRGWSVWWDRNIATGQEFVREIERALAQALCVIVLWSRASVSSEWVELEAGEARERRVLLPVLIEEVKPPLEFRRLQTARLLGWPGTSRHQGFERLVQDISRLVAKPAMPAPTRQRTLRQSAALALLIAPTAIAVLLGSILMTWRVPTAVRLALTVERAEFTLAPAEPPLARILDSIAFTAITVERFATVSLEPKTIEVADPAQYRLAEDRFPESAWRAVASAGVALEFRARDDMRLPSVTVERGAREAGALGTLRPITVPAPSAVALELAGERRPSMTLKLAHREPVLRLPMSGLIQLTAAQTTVTGLLESPDPETQARTWRLALQEGSAPVEIKGEPGLLAVSVTLAPVPAGQPVTLFSGGAISVTAVDFTRQDALGHRVSAVVEEGQLSYPDRPRAAPWTVRRSDLVALDGLQRFEIRHIAVDPARPGMQLDLEGIAGRVSTRQGPVSTDHRLRALDRVTRQPGWLELGLLAWLIPTGAGVYWLLARRSALKEARA